MKNVLKKERGISLITLTFAVLILVIITNVLIYNVGDSVEIKKLNNLYSDIEDLRDKVIEYDNKYEMIPAKKPIAYNKLGNLQSVLNDEEKNNKDFYILDLESLSGVTLNYGEGYKNIAKDLETYQGDETDLYIINKVTYNIFNLGGVTVKLDNGEQTYYTDYTQPDNVTIDLRYIEGVLIPDDYYYIGKSRNIVISTTKTDSVNLNNPEQFEWIKQDSKIGNLTDIQLEGNNNGSILKNSNGSFLAGSSEETGFINSVNINKGFFKNTENKVKYVYIDGQNMWSEEYTQTKEFIDSKGKIATIPIGFKVSMSPFENTVDDGLVVSDENGNEYVWIPCTSAEYENSTKISQWAEDNGKAIGIDNGLGNRKNWIDRQSTEVGLASLRRMEENQITPGFYVSRFETGEPGTPSDPPNSKKGFSVWQNITRSNAISKAQSLFENDEIASYLMDSHAWDTICLKMIEQTNQRDISWDSSNIGNYGSNLGQVAGDSERFRIYNIYDMGGNMWEMTTEITEDNQYMIRRGGSFNDNGLNCPIIMRDGTNNLSLSNNSTGFRAVLYFK